MPRLRFCAAALRRRPRSTAAASVVLALALSLAWPASLEDAPTAHSLRLTDRHGTLLREVRPEGRGQAVRLEAVSPAAIEALIATEDRAFYRHPGVNPAALVRAAWANARAGRVVSGGSTLTMQVARALRGRRRASLGDKLAEIHLALRLELRYSKDEILEAWLRRVSFGNRAHGIESAARLYFDKPARDLAAAEAAFLVGLPQSPSRYNPFRHFDRAKARQRRVLAAMQAHGALTADERARIEALPLDLADPEQAFRAPHFTRFVLGLLPDEHSLREIRTTLDLRLQRRVEEILRGHLRQLRGATVTNGAAVVLDNRTGVVLAYAGSVAFWNDAAGGQNDGVQMLRQPGSALKPFTYARALQHGYTPASILPDIEMQVIEAGGAFSPENYDKRYHGPVPLREALASSYNVPAVRLAREMGPAALLETLHAVGFASLDKPAEHYGVGLTLGSGEVRLVELARAYAGLARGGSLPALRVAEAQVTAVGDTLHAPSRPPALMGLDVATAYLITDILSDPEARAPGFGRGGPLELPFPVAVKTGTSKDYRDNWTVGYTPRHTVAVWVGNFDGAPMRWVSGVTGAGPVFHAIMQALGSGGAFARPPGVMEATICPSSGRKPGVFCSSTRRTVFARGTVPSDTCDVHRRLRLDRRTGLRADAATPKADVEEKIFAVYPAEYHPWMRAHGRPLPPPAAHLVTDSSSSDALRPSDRLRIQYPVSGTAFQMDPVLRAGFQKVHLRGTVEESSAASLMDVQWWIDGEPLGGDYRTAAWPLRPGTYRIELRAIDREGQRLRSRSAIIEVRAARASALGGQ